MEPLRISATLSFAVALGDARDPFTADFKQAMAERLNGGLASHRTSREY